MSEPTPSPMPYASAPGAGPGAGPSAGPGASRTNVLAIIALIGAFVFAPVGIICGHIALSQIRQTGEAGHGLALWGTILGYVFVALYIIGFVLWFTFIAFVVQTGNQYQY